MSVVENWMPPPPALLGVGEHGWEKEVLALARRGVSRVHALLPGWDVEAATGFGSPGSAILEKADEWGADLIVAGTHGRSALGRFVLGSVSQKLLHEARCSVRVGRGDPRKAAGPLRLVLGFDGSHECAAVARVLAARRWPEGTEVRVVNASWSLPASTPDHSIERLSEWLTRENLTVKEMVEAVANNLRACGLTASTLVRVEEPKRLLLQETERWGADCIFVGARGAGSLERLLIGSVSSAVAARAHCSVEVVRGIKPGPTAATP